MSDVVGFVTVTKQDIALKFPNARNSVTEYPVECPLCQSKFKLRTDPMNDLFHVLPTCQCSLSVRAGMSGNQYVIMAVKPE